MNIFLIVLFLFIAYKLLKAKFNLKYLKEDIEYHLFKINEEILNDRYNPLLYAKRGSMYQMIQDFPKANNDFYKALSLLNVGEKPRYKGKEPIVNDFEESLLKNIKYTEKPHPWVKYGPRDLSNNWFAFFLIERFGYKRRNF